MRNQRGRMTFGNIVFTLIILYLAFVLFQFARAYMRKMEIQGEVINRVGALSNNDESSLVKEVQGILGKKEVTVIDVKITKTGKGTDVYVQYELETDYLISQHKEKITIQKNVAAY